MKKYLLGLGAVTLLTTGMTPSIQVNAENEKTDTKVVSEKEQEPTIILETPGKLKEDPIGTLVYEKYIGGEQKQIVRIYEYAYEQDGGALAPHKKGFYEEFQLPKSITEKVDKLKPEVQLTEAKKMLADYYKEAENWPGLTSLLLINTPKFKFKDISVSDEIKEQVISDEKTVLDELENNTTRDLKKDEYKEIWSYVTEEEQVNNKYRTIDVIKQAAEERIDSTEDKFYERKNFIPVVLFTFITLLVGVILLTRR